MPEYVMSDSVEAPQPLPLSATWSDLHGAPGRVAEVGSVATGPASAAPGSLVTAHQRGEEDGVLVPGAVLPRSAEFRFCVTCEARGRLFVRRRCQVCRVVS